MGLYICCKCHWRTSERAARGRPCKVWKFATSAAQYTRAFGSMYLTSLVIVCVCVVMTVLAAAFYNLFSELTGGLEVTVVEHEDEH